MIVGLWWGLVGGFVVVFCGGVGGVCCFESFVELVSLFGVVDLMFLWLVKIVFFGGVGGWMFWCFVDGVSCCFVFGVVCLIGWLLGVVFCWFEVLEFFGFWCELDNGVVIDRRGDYEICVFYLVDYSISKCGVVIVDFDGFFCYFDGINESCYEVWWFY